MRNYALWISSWIICLPAWAEQSMPWEPFICSLAKSLTGPTASGASVIVVVLGGLMLAFGELSSVFSWGVRAAIGLSLALLTNDWIGLIKPGATVACLGG